MERKRQAWKTVCESLSNVNSFTFSYWFLFTTVIIINIGGGGTTADFNYHNHPNIITSDKFHVHPFQALVLRATDFSPVIFYGENGRVHMEYRPTWPKVVYTFAVLGDLMKGIGAAVYDVLQRASENYPGPHYGDLVEHPIYHPYRETIKSPKPQPQFGPFDHYILQPNANAAFPGGYHTLPTNLVNQISHFQPDQQTLQIIQSIPNIQSFSSISPIMKNQITARTQSVAHPVKVLPSASQIQLRYVNRAPVSNLKPPSKPKQNLLTNLIANVIGGA